MLPILELIKRIRTTVHDKQELEYSDEDIMKSINGGIRFLRRTIKEYKPAMIAEDPIRGILQPGENKVILPVIPTKFLDVRINGTRVNSVHFANISDYTRKETPYAYYQTGLKTINFYPTPNTVTEYQILVVGDHTEATLNDTTPFPNDFDDFLIEYAVIRLSFGNEFNMADEKEVMSVIHEQIKANLIGSELQVNYVEGYWGSYYDDLDGCIKGI